MYDPIEKDGSWYSMFYDESLKIRGIKFTHIVAENSNYLMDSLKKSYAHSFIFGPWSGKFNKTTKRGK